MDDTDRELLKLLGDHARKPVIAFSGSIPFGIAW